MGWTGYYTPPADKMAEIERLITYENTRPLLTRKVGSVFYSAMEKTVSEPVDDYEVIDGKYVSAAVFLTQTYRGEWLYKDLHEAMGPYEAKCPPGILNLLSNTTNDCALEWRAKCRAWAGRRRVKAGETITLAEPWEPYGSVFIKVNDVHKRRRVYRSAKTGDLVRLNAQQIYGAT